MRKKGKLSTIVLFVAGAGCVIAALVILFTMLWDRRQSNKTFETLREDYCKVTSAEDVSETEAGNSHFWYENVEIDFEGIKEINEDVIGWIRFDGIEIIDYPIMYSGDDETYLRNDIYGNKSTAGCIFLEGANHPDFEDYHTIIYGHNMKNLSMFGSLKKYKEEGFYVDHSYFTIYTENMAYRYQIFAYRDVPETDSVYTIGFIPDDMYQNFLNEMVRKSYIDTGVSVSKEDKIITLSTCSTTGNRFIVQAVRVDEKAYQ